MATEVLMPKLSDTMQEGTILRWLKKQNEPIHKGEPLLEVETDKANMEIEAFEDGVLAEILAEEGATIRVGETIARIAEKGTTPQPTRQSKAVAKEEVEKAERETKPPEQHQAPPKPQPIEAELEEPTEPAPQLETPPQREITPRMKVSPSARKRAHELEVDLSQVQGSGPGGRIVRADVEHFAPQPVPQEKHAPEQLGTQVAELTKIQQAVGKQMTRSKQEIPHFYLSLTVQADELLGILKKLQADMTEVRLTITHLILFACIKALIDHPRFNATFEEDQLICHQNVNLALAMALEKGLIAPVLHHVEQDPLAQLASRSHDLVERAKKAILKENELKGGTFTVSNMGMYHVDQFSAIITPPQVAALAVGGIKEDPIVQDSQITIGHQMILTLSADHRVANGADAAVFLDRIRYLLEHPLTMLL